ncbi:zinc finger CCCH domain-containing protein 3 [Hemicordylus capensis]|uniref:zinc finger CCCH domain-containing protein 3 n=1 Tax=Hemicordylus capensis TaxID=884348 RepID=UPI0023030C4D|nr:zinc finger CCCH domain-containing protein 3 [Hemicordylus capensis]XP_053106186.1 zinc finger CCCH domain-containing protein 3 [Hemicordylus capensis]
MEEKEQLRRQIRLLQGLIDDHKNTHGNAPVQEPRWRNPRPPAFSNPSVFSARYSQQTQRDFQPHQSNAWRKKYSLVNVPPRPVLSSGGGVSDTAARTVLVSSSTEASEPQLVLPERSVGFREGDNLVVGVRNDLPVGHATVLGSQQGPLGAASSLAASRGCVSAPGPPDVARGRGNTSAGSLRRPVTARAVRGAPEAASDLCRTISESAVAMKSETVGPQTFPDCESVCLSARKKPAPQVPALHSSPQAPAVTVKPDPGRVAGTSAGCAHSTREASSAVGMSLSKHKHSVPSLQRTPTLPASAKSQKFKKTNYTWVANPNKCVRTVKRCSASRASENARTFAVGAERVHKLLPRGDLGAKQKKSNPHSKLGVSSSKYKWKAFSLQPSPSTSASAFTWQRKECDRAGVSHCTEASTSLQAARCAPLGHSNARPSFGNTGFFTYKLKSRTKIIKRKGSACALADKKSASSFPTVLLKSRYSLRKRHSPRGKASPAARRAGSKGLVLIGKHRLRRLLASRGYVSAKEGSSFLRVTNPTANKVVNTRYRIVKKAVASPLGSTASFGSPAHGWKARRLSASRSLALNSPRPPSPGSKPQALQHRWRSKGLRCIGGVMYRVSANKLAKTSSSPARGSEPASRSYARAARLDSAHSSPGYSPPSCPSRLATSRYIASRAVQRSLAIIRQAKQKKEKKKEYCMYYNRFGKCNRGESCPYIHDPDKVAVCTRFLRGTCKKTDGTCPFSHKVSKDKMPVCSYFLKGICNNSDCPYSHVYVSRKAEVCPDFLKGYCPLGEKCKKKHTLVCPDFSKNGVCPKGAQCKLLHPQRKHQARQLSTTDSFPQQCSVPKRERLADQTMRLKEEEEETPGPSGTEHGAPLWSQKAPLQTSKLTKLPSFISLQSPPTSPVEEEPQPARDRSMEEAGKPLQIKPRL